MQDQTHFSRRLLAWWDENGRKDLPWQDNKTPYRVWVSEIMLQQTQVASVIEYYQRFMRTFPDIESLANAHEDTILEHWAGLGYYARARNLHKTAKLICDTRKGEFPDSLEAITELPGIGRSTAGAILSIAFKKRAPILDGNVKRVLCRFNAVTTWPGEKKTENELWNTAEQFTPTERVADYTQAIMDLGATLCTRSKPQCQRCPFVDDCKAFAATLQNELPKSKPKKAIPTKTTRVLHLANRKGEILLEKRPATGIWGGLYSLPEASTDTDLDELKRQIEQQWGVKIIETAEQKGFVHVFSHYKLQIHPLFLQVEAVSGMVNEIDKASWFLPDALKKIGLPAPIGKYLKQNVQTELHLSLE